MLAEAGESIARFIDSGITRLKAKLGPINWQFMATKKFDAADFEAFLSLLPKSVDGMTLRHAVEARHESFACAAFVTLCRRYGVAIVAGCDSEFPCIADVSAGFVYVRAMGTTQKEKAGYSRAKIARWAARAKAWEAGGAPGDLKLLAKAAARTEAARCLSFRHLRRQGAQSGGGGGADRRPLIPPEPPVGFAIICDRMMCPPGHRPRWPGFRWIACAGDIWHVNLCNQFQYVIVNHIKCEVHDVNGAYRR